MAISSTSTETFVSRAPTRIDLAGGTLDLWPLYLFLERPTTLNLGIDLFAEARLEASPAQDPSNPEITLRTEDQNLEQKWSWRALQEASQIPPALELHLKLLRFFGREHTPKTNLCLSTRAKSPAGAGLGGSSTLSIAMVGALASWARNHVIDPLKDGEALIEIVRDIETTVIQVPAGVQDYYGAMFGGLQSLRWGAGKHQRDWLPLPALRELEKRILLFYSGQSRNSGINNWALFKAFIDRQGDTRAHFKQINEATLELEAAIAAKDWSGVGRAIAREWSIRRGLAPGISTTEIDEGFHAARNIAPTLAGKVCGAGGGGCFFVYLDTPEAATLEKVKQTFMDAGMRALPFQAVPQGLQVQVMRA